MMNQNFSNMFIKKSNTSISLASAKLTKRPQNLTQNLSKRILTRSKPLNHNRNYIKDIIVSSADESTTHGIDHIFKRKHPLIRFLWAVCFVVSATICFYMITMSIIAYFNYETVTKTQQVIELSAEFPAVSICNLNPFLTNKSWQFVESVLVENELVSPNPSTDYFKNILNDKYEYLRYFVGFNSFKSNLTDEFRKSFGYDLNETLLSCSYNIEFCTVDDFEWYYDFMYGNCYKFNSGKYRNGSKAPIRMTSKAGSVNGLTIELFIYEPTHPMSLSNDHGAHVLVHNKSDFPAFYEGVSVSSGTKANVQIERVFSYHMEKPYSDCIRVIEENYPSPLVKTILQTGYKYTQQNCFLACYQDVIFEKCGCYDIYSQVLSGVPPLNTSGAIFCTNYTQISCDIQEFVKFFSDGVESFCSSKCPLECESIKYNMHTSESNYPSKAYAELLMQNPIIQAKYVSNLSQLTFDSLKRNLVQISVFYSDMGYQKFEELEKIKIGDLVSRIGGTLGLFLGMSFLSFVEILDILLQIFFYKKSS